jgi:hypothetical protein
MSAATCDAWTRLRFPTRRTRCSRGRSGSKNAIEVFMCWEAGGWRLARPKPYARTWAEHVLVEGEAYPCSLREERAALPIIRPIDVMHVSEADPSSGVVDFFMFLAPGVEGIAGSRGGGSEYVFTQFQPPGMSDESTTISPNMERAVRHGFNRADRLLLTFAMSVSPQ